MIILPLTRFCKLAEYQWQWYIFIYKVFMMCVCVHTLKYAHRYIDIKLYKERDYNMNLFNDLLLLHILLDLKWLKLDLGSLLRHNNIEVTLFLSS